MRNARQTKAKLLKAESIQNWSETFVVDNGRQDVRSETLLADTTQVLEEEIHIVISEHSIVQTEGNLNYTITATKKEHRTLAFASSKQTSEEPSVKFELLHRSAEVNTGLHEIQQEKLFQVTMF